MINIIPGVHCDINVDDCNPNLCQNNATCKDLVKDYSCECFSGYRGKFNVIHE